MSDPFAILISCYSGRFDICDPSRTEWKLEIKCRHGKAIVFTSDDPGIDDYCGVEDALCAMEAAFKHVWMGSKEESLRIIALIWSELPKFELSRYRQIRELQVKKVERAKADLDNLDDTIAYLEREASEDIAS